jgi:hypothetical protein
VERWLIAQRLPCACHVCFLLQNEMNGRRSHNQNEMNGRHSPNGGYAAALAPRGYGDD